MLLDYRFVSRISQSHFVDGEIIAAVSLNFTTLKSRDRTHSIGIFNTANNRVQPFQRDRYP